MIVNGNPYVLVLPAIFIDFIASPEDTNLKFQFANFLKILRMIAIALTLLLPGIYISIVNFHQELIPTELLFSILASRENVPFPVIFEIIVMEVSFELIREARFTCSFANWTHNRNSWCFSAWSSCRFGKYC